MNLLFCIKKIIRLKCVQDFPSKKYKLTKLKKVPSVINLKKHYSTFTISHKFTNLDVPVLLTNSGDFDVLLILNYNYYQYTEIIHIICDRPMPSSYETIGDVIHFNLNDEHLPYKFIIGKILYDKTGCTIINKLGNINSQYRYYDFEYIGGKIDIKELINKKELILDGTKYSINNIEPIFDQSKNTVFTVTKNDLTSLKKEDFDKDMLDLLLETYCINNKIIKVDKLETTLIENGSRFQIDIKNVYWCSKLQDERKNLLDIIKPREVVCDVFCGVGPMVIPLLLKKCIVYCNDLNDKAIICLRKNMTLNKIQSEIFIENMDAKLYLKNMKEVKIDHYILNLPEYSLDYIKYISKGTIHCYFFSTENDVVDYVFNKTGVKNQNIRFIRKVSPSKNVYKLTLKK